MNKRIFNLLATLIIAIAPTSISVSCGGGNGGDSGRVVNVTGVSLDRHTLEIGPREETRLVATVVPANANDQTVLWESDTPSVATVTNGKVTGVGIGDARITVTTNNGGYKDYCLVYVRNIPVQGVSLDKTNITLVVGNTDTLTPMFLPPNATNRNVSWNSSNPNIARVEGDGVVRAMAPGTATIKVTTQDGSKTATCAVGVLSESEAVRVTGVTLNKTSLALSVGGSDVLVATVQPVNATNRNVEWSSNNTAIATVAGGTVTAMAIGNATITVKTSDGGITATCAVTVMTATVPVTGVALNKTSLTLNVGSSETLIPTIQPSNATNKSVTWSSSSDGVATVSTLGLVTAVAPGSAAITVTTQDGGKTATCAVTVPTAALAADVYVAGYTYENNGGYYGKKVALLWKNGVAQPLSAGIAGEARKVFVSGDDVYVLGELFGDYTLWKNGVAQTFPIDACVSDVFVSGNDVYLVGGVGNTAILWKNGTPQPVSTSSLPSGATCVYVSGSDVYVAGEEWVNNQGGTMVTLWKNGVATYLPPDPLGQHYGGRSRANDVFVSGNDVYVVGVDGTTMYGNATLWKNGIPQILSSVTNSVANAVFVSNGDVYVAGTQYSRATLWKNGVAQAFGTGDNAYDVFVHGNDVYVVSRAANQATLWKNGESMTLDSSQYTSYSEAYSVFVK